MIRDLWRAIRCPSLVHCLCRGKVDCRHCGCYLRPVKRVKFDR